MTVPTSTTSRTSTDLHNLPLVYSPHAFLDSAPQARRRRGGRPAACLRLGGGRGRGGARERPRPGHHRRRHRRPGSGPVQRPPLAGVPGATRPRRRPVPARPGARRVGDWRGGHGRHRQRIGSGAALSHQGRTPRERGHRPGRRREHRLLGRERSPLVRGRREPSGAARVGRVPHAAPQDPRHPAWPRAVHVPRARLADPVQSPAQRGLLPGRGAQGPRHLALQPLSVAMQLDSRRIYTGRVVRLDVDTVRFPDGSTGQLELIRHPGAAAIVPCASDPPGADPTILLIRQYRYATGGQLWEIPAGTLDPGEEPEACARRELLEETGVTAARLERLTSIWTTPGFTNEVIHLYLATGLTSGEPSRERDEFIEVVPQPLSRVRALIRDGEISDAKTVGAILYMAEFVFKR